MRWLLGVRGGFNLQVKTMSGKTVVLDNVQGSDSILEIKRRVEQREGIPVDQQRLVFNGKQLENGKTVQDYDLSENSVLHLVLRLRGGA
ncbi:UNVERIFIED_CONTAM: ubiquitin family protein [Hammondia hammondi]|eukprot:XP_008886151.1 ubiquitin family protein [Hammondia hammondi]